MTPRTISTQSLATTGEPSAMRVFGIDIGGANIKACDQACSSVSRPFPMWTDYHQLGKTVQAMLSELGADPTASNWLAVTMTGELADCFATRRQGVSEILGQLERALPAQQIIVYAVGGKWLSTTEARQNPWSVAASNWYALAQWLLSQSMMDIGDCQVIMDIGSTTVDIIPIQEGRIQTHAQTDRDRLQLGQLVYTGMERTPVHAVVQTLVIDNFECPVMAERFATINDAYLLLDKVAPQPENCDTADGQPRTLANAHARMARMIGEDNETLPLDKAKCLAEHVIAAQCRQVAAALLRNLSLSDCDEPPSGNVLVAGHGGPMIEHLRTFPELRQVCFRELTANVDATVSRCAPAWAVAKLWEAHLAIGVSHG